MRKHWIVTWITLAVALLAGLLYALWPRQLPPEQCSPEYRRFAGNPHVGVAYLPQFQLNDTLTVAVTVLKALDSAGWEEMRTTLNIDNPTEEQKARMAAGGDAVWSWLAPKGHPELLKDSVYENNNFIAASLKHQTLSIFHINNKSECRAVLFYSQEKNFTN